MLRPLVVDLAITLLPFAVAVAVACVGWHVRRLSRSVQVGLALVVTTTILLPLMSTRGYLPVIFERSIAVLGGVTTVEAIASAFLICVVWKAPKRSTSSGFLAVLLGIVGVIIAIDNAGTMRWRLHASQSHDPLWSNRCDDRGLMRQSTGITCAPAAAAMLLARFGVDVSEGELAYRASTSSFGTDHFELADAVGAIVQSRGGVSEANRESAAAVVTANEPCVVFIDTQFGSHAVLLESCESSVVHVADPLGGRRYEMSIDAFTKAFQGPVIRVSVPAATALSVP